MTRSSSWPTELLSSLCLPVSKMDPKDTGREQVLYVDIGSVDGDRHGLVDVASVSSASAPSRCRQILRAGDTVFSTVRPYLEKIAFIDQKLDAEFASTGFCVLRPGPRLNPRFLFYYSISRGMLNQVIPHQRGVSYPAVLDKQVRSSSMPVPAMQEQRRIVDILEDHLSRLDAAAADVGQAEARLLRLRQSWLDRLFGPRVGETIRLNDLVEGITAGRSFGGAAPSARMDQWGVIKVSAMTWGAFKPDENKAIDDNKADSRNEIRSGDLLVSRANTSDYVGASVLVGDVRPRLLLSDKSLRLAPQSGVNREWLWRALSAPGVRRQISARATGTKDSMRNISQRALLSIEIPQVGRVAQESAVNRMRALDDAIDGLRSAVVASQRRQASLRRALLEAGFSGKLTGRHTDTEVIEETAAEQVGAL